MTDSTTPQHPARPTTGSGDWPAPAASNSYRPGGPYQPSAPHRYPTAPPPFDAPGSDQPNETAPGWPGLPATQRGSAFDPPSGGAPYGPSGRGPYGHPFEPPPAPRPRRRRALGVAALAVAGCLLAGTAGGALGVELASDESSVETRSAGSTTATQTSAVDGTVQGAADEIMPSTVVISVTGTASSPTGPTRTGGSGSGVVLDTEGHILTNAHVVASVQDATIEVMLPGGQVVPAEIVGVDASSDLAVLRLDEVDGLGALQPAVFADSDALDIGQPVVAVGAPLGLTGTVTQGIVSAVDRPVRTGQSADASTVLDAIQTDAAINPGNSGGPLVNLAGEVVGINSAIATVGSSGGQSGNIGVGFAIPSNDATDIAAQLIADGTAEHASLGVSASESESGRGATVRSVEPGSPAAAAGLQPGDVITQVADRIVPDLDSLLAAIRDHAPGDAVTLIVQRDDAEQTITITLGSRTG